MAGFPSPHDLVHVGDRCLLTGPDGRKLPPDAQSAVASSVSPADGGGWVVVRRAPHAPGRVPVGIRGRRRSERFAAEAELAGITRVVTPHMVDLTPPAPRSALPAFTALERFRREGCLLDPSSSQWGPAGSAAFELVTHRPVVSRASDLDIVITAPTPLDIDTARRLLEGLEQYGCRVDIQIAAPAGAFALSEWVREHGRQVAVRTDEGPSLCRDPWRARS